MTSPTVALRVSLVQAETLWHDTAGNREKYGALVRGLTGTTDLVVLPETFTTGFTNETLGNAEPMEGPSVDWFRALATEVSATLLGSVLVRDGDRCRNRLLCAQPDGSLAFYDKRHLFRMAGEHERFVAGERRLVVEVRGFRVCPMVCYDLRFPVWLRNRYSPAEGRFDYDLLVFVANWPAVRRPAWRTLLRARAIENLAYCAGVNRVGVDGNGIAYAGDSAVHDYLGQSMVECGAQPQVVTVALPGEALAAHRERFPAQLDADDFELR